MAITWEPLVRLISNLEKAHPRVPSNIPGKSQLDRTSGCREMAVTDTHTQTDTQTDKPAGDDGPILPPFYSTKARTENFLSPENFL